MKLAVFDFDSTLMEGETIDILAREVGLEEEVAKITNSAMSGRVDFYKSLTARVRLLEGLKVSVVDEICHSLPLMNGAKETIKELKKANYKILCFSGGFRNATSYYREILNIDADFSNILHYEDGILTGNVGGDMMFNNSKGDMLERLQRLLGVKKEDTIAIGDGANDKSMFPFAKIKVAFCAKEVLKREANVIIEEKDLTKILEYI